MSGLLFKFVKLALRSQYKKPAVYGIQNYDPETPGIFLSNHERFYGPIIVTTRFPIPVRQWATSLMMDLEDTKIYVKETLFMDTLKIKEGIATLLGSLAAHPISWTIRSANPIPAYWDAKKSAKSIKYGLEAIKKGENQLIYAANCKPADEDFNFMQGYLILAKFANKILGVNPKIYPVALNKKKGNIAIGAPALYNIKSDFNAESLRINQYIIEQIRQGYNSPNLFDN